MGSDRRRPELCCVRARRQSTARGVERRMHTAQTAITDSSARGARADRTCYPDMNVLTSYRMALNFGALDYVLFLLCSLVYLISELRPVWWVHFHHDEKPDKHRGSATTAQRKTVADVPGPKPRVPVLGTRWIFSSFFGQYKLSKLHEAYADLFVKHGPIIREDALWNYPVVSLLAREDIEKVFRASGRYPIRPPTEVTVHYRKSRPDRYTRAGFINEQGEDWHQLRSSLTSGMQSLLTLKKFAPEMAVMSEDLVRLLRDNRDPQTGLVKGFDMLSKRIGLESISMLVLGKRMGFLDAEMDERATALSDGIRGYFKGTRDTYFGLPTWKFLPSHGYSLYAKSEEAIYDIVSTFVDQTLGEVGDTCPLDMEGDVFMSILHAPGIDLRDKKATIVDFIAAGIHTLGTSLVLTMYQLAKHPEVQQRLYEELLEIAPDSSQLTSDAIKGAKYLKACVLEAYRVQPTAPCVARVLESELELSGYNLTPGTVVLCHTWLACLREENFTDATSFRPERWLPEFKDTLLSSPMVISPYGNGKRGCPGKRFAEMELNLVCAKLIREFELSCDDTLELAFEFLLVPESPVNIVFRDRN